MPAFRGQRRFLLRTSAASALKWSIGNGEGGVGVGCKRFERAKQRGAILETRWPGAQRKAVRPRWNVAARAARSRSGMRCHETREFGGIGRKPIRRSRGHREHPRAELLCRWNVRRGLQHEMRIGAAEAEGAHSGAARAPSRVPARLRFGVDDERRAGKCQVRVLPLGHEWSAAARHAPAPAQPSWRRPRRRMLADARHCSSPSRWRTTRPERSVRRMLPLGLQSRSDRQAACRCRGTRSDRCCPAAMPKRSWMPRMSRVCACGLGAAMPLVLPSD